MEPEPPGAGGSGGPGGPPPQPDPPPGSGGPEPTYYKGHIVYDYSVFRRLTFYQVSTDGSKDKTVVQIEGFDGRDYTSPTEAQWTEAYPSDVCPCIGSPGHYVAVTSKSITIAAVPGTDCKTVAMPDELKNSGRLRLITTPWAIYLVTETSYTRITPVFTAYNSTKRIAGIQLITSIVTNIQDAKLYPATFCGVDENTVVVFGRFTHYDYFNAEEVVETHMLFLEAYPKPGTPGNGIPESHPTVLATEKILDGEPVSMGAVRDPSVANRVVGHCGGQMFQVSDKMPWTVERLTPGDMSAAELIEHVCQLHHAIAVPSPDGVLHIVSRNLAEPVQRMELPRSIISVDECHTWEDHASYIVVSGESDEHAGCYPDGRKDRTIPGGNTLEITGHPMVFSATAAKAMAAAYGQYFGVPRRTRKMQLAWLDTDALPPWMKMGPLPTVSFNNEDTTWAVMACEHREKSGEATLTLVQSLGASWGQDWGA
jgi:hypothetical protein